MHQYGVRLRCPIRILGKTTKVMHPPPLLARGALNARPTAPPRYNVGRVGSLAVRAPRMRPHRDPSHRVNTYRYKKDSETPPTNPDDEDLHLKKVHGGELSLDESQLESEPFVPMEALEALAAEEEELKEEDLQALSEVDLEAKLKEEEVTDTLVAVEEDGELKVSRRSNL